jgi:hypothetical protein
MGLKKFLEVCNFICESFSIGFMSLQSYKIHNLVKLEIFKILFWEFFILFTTLMKFQFWS